MTQKDFSPRDLRNALSSFATGVTIITSCETDGTIVGMTASSFNSVSMEPPLILWSVTKTALSAECFRTAEYFNVHVLASDQSDLSNAFAKSGTDKFAHIDFTVNEFGVPVLNHAAARFDCKTWAVHEGGDHWIIIGEVMAIDRQPTDGLVFSGGAYASTTPLRPAHADPEIMAQDHSHVDGLLLYNLSLAYRQMADHFHHTVRESGLTVREWRVLASLHGDQPHSLTALSERTAINPRGLLELLSTMREADHCQIEGSGDSMHFRSTRKGNAIAERLFAVNDEQEKSAIGNDEDRAQLLALLKHIIAHTDD